MKKIVIISLCLFFMFRAYSQESKIIAIDNNPQLSSSESNYLNQLMIDSTYDFTNKRVMFFNLTSGGYFGIGKWAFHETKKLFFNSLVENLRYRIFKLDSNERLNSKGIDAFLVYASPRHKGKLKRLKREKIVGTYVNRYPKIPTDAGRDDNENLSAANAAFFNELYEKDILQDVEVNFNGKKLAIFETFGFRKEPMRKSIPEYVERVKAYLLQHDFYNTDFTYILTPNQKIKSGGYDVIIQYMCKPDLPVEELINSFNKSKK